MEPRKREDKKDGTMLKIAGIGLGAGGIVTAAAAIQDPTLTIALAVITAVSGFFAGLVSVLKWLVKTLLDHANDQMTRVIVEQRRATDSILDRIDALEENQKQRSLRNWRGSIGQSTPADHREAERESNEHKAVLSDTNPNLSIAAMALHK